MKKKALSLFFNFSIIILEIIGIIVGFKKNGRLGLEYYTVQSNILALISSMLYLIFILTKKGIPRLLQLFKYTSTVCVTLTFCVVVLVLAPMYNFNYGYILFYNSLIFQHFLCPILTVITFIFFDEVGILGNKDGIKSMSITFIYAVIFTLLNVFDKIKGPYPFLMVKDQSILSSIMWYTLIFIMTYLITLVLRKAKKRTF